MIRIWTTLALLGSLAQPLVGNAQSAFNGTWKADLDKDQYSDQTDVRELRNGSYDCRSCDPPFKIAADGHDQPVAGNSMYDTLSVRVVDDRTVATTAKKSGKLMAESTLTVSGDGNTETIRQVVSGVGPQPFTVTKTFSRIAAGAPGSHAISGEWQTRRTEASENVDVQTFNVAGDVLTMTNVNGGTYTARFNGPVVPFVGDPRWNFVSVKLIDSRTIEETLRKDDTIVIVTRWMVAADGRAMQASFDDLHGHVFKQSGHKVP